MVLYTRTRYLVYLFSCVRTFLFLYHLLAFPVLVRTLPMMILMPYCKTDDPTLFILTILIQP